MSSLIKVYYSMTYGFIADEESLVPAKLFDLAIIFFSVQSEHFSDCLVFLVAQGECRDIIVVEPLLVTISNEFLRLRLPIVSIVYDVEVFGF